jgi:hypothetical protein
VRERRSHPSAARFRNPDQSPFPSDPFDNALRKARDRDWCTYEVPSGYDVMIDAFDSLVRVLVDVAIGRD